MKSREPEDRHSREGNQSKDSRDAHHTTDPHNTVQGSRPYSEIIQSRTVPRITNEGEDQLRRSTAGNQAREGNDGKPDIVSVNENNGLSSPPASYASEMQNHIDNTGDPSSDGETDPGSTLSVHAAHSLVPSCITGAQDVDEEDTEISMLKNDVDDFNVSGFDYTTRVEGEYETGDPTSLVEAAEERRRSRSDSLNNSPGKRSATDHSFGEETLAATTDQSHPTSTTSTASDKAVVTVGEDSSTDIDSEATDIAHDKEDTATNDNVNLCTLATNASTKGNPHLILNVYVPKPELRQRSGSCLVTGHGPYGQLRHADPVLSVTPAFRTPSKEFK